MKTSYELRQDPGLNTILWGRPRDKARIVYGMLLFFFLGVVLLMKVLNHSTEQPISSGFSRKLSRAEIVLPVPRPRSQRATANVKSDGLPATDQA